VPRGELRPGDYSRRGLVGAERHGFGLGLFELLLAEAGARLVQAVLCADVVEARRACGHAGPYRSAGGRLVGERDDAARRWGCAEKLQRERLAVATASRSPAD
jgi:hypothetical protein